MDSQGSPFADGQYGLLERWLSEIEQISYTFNNIPLPRRRICSLEPLI